MKPVPPARSSHQDHRAAARGSLLWLLCASGALAQSAPATLEGRLGADGRTLEMTVRGRAGDTYQFQSSSNLTTWLTLEKFQLATDTRIISRSAEASTREYFRTLATTDAPASLDLPRGFVSIHAGAPGDEISVFGDFSSVGAPGEQAITIGGVDSPIVFLGPTNIVVKVPEGGASGPVSIHIAGNTYQTGERVVVLKSLPVTVEPPPGSQASEYLASTAFGEAPASRVRVRDRLPTLVLASSTNPANPVVLMGISDGQAADVRVNATSTAEAMLFLSPWLATSNPDALAGLLEDIRSDAPSAVFGSLVRDALAAGSSVLNHAGLAAAYSNALVSVVARRASNIVHRAASPPAGSDSPRPRAALATGHVGFDLDWTEVASRTDAGAPFNAQQRQVVTGMAPLHPHLSPVHWVVESREVDVDRAFPEGADDLARLRGPSAGLVDFPLLDGYRDSRVLEPHDYGFDFSELTQPVVVATTVAAGRKYESARVPLTFPKPAALYVLRSLGPGFLPANELAFVAGHYAAERNLSIAINAAGGVVDLISSVINLETPVRGGAASSIATRIALNAAAESGSVRSPGDFLILMARLATSELGGIANELRDAGLGRPREIVLRKAFEQLAQSDLIYANPLLTGIDESQASVGPGLRTYGTWVTSPMETALVSVGDPFALEVLAVQPPAVPAGGVFKVQVKASARIRAFDPARDSARLDGPDILEPSFLATEAGPSGEDSRTLVFQMPRILKTNTLGNYDLVFRFAGRSGRAKVRLLPAELIVRGLVPTEGFRGTPPGPGSAVNILGEGFDARDEFFFSGAAAGLRAPRTAFDYAGVTVSVPQGARTGPILIVHRRSDGSTTNVLTGEFTVLEPPKILSTQSESIPPGGLLYLELDYLPASGGGAQFGPSSVGGFVQGPYLAVPVPFGTRSGTIGVSTIGGRSDFELRIREPLGPIDGSSISVGVAQDPFADPATARSPISLEDALRAMGGGLTFPDDDDKDDFLGGIPRFEPGDYVQPDYGPDASPRFKYGAPYRDNVGIGGPVSGEVTLHNESIGLQSSTDRFVIHGNSNHVGIASIGGTFVVTGDYNNIGFSGTNGDFVLQGSHNLVTIDSRGAAIRIEGHGNTFGTVRISRCPTNALVVTGNFNYMRDVEITSNSGDGIQIIGGRYNNIDVDNLTANGGHGAFVTGGAEGNRLKLVTCKLSIRTDELVQGSGNKGHGLMLSGVARSNVFEIYGGGISGNGGCGVMLDGPEVAGNVFDNIQCGQNGEHGFLMTNGVVGTRFPRTLVANNNKLSGFAQYGGMAVSSAGFLVAGNGDYGVLLSGVTNVPPTQNLRVQSGDNSQDVAPRTGKLLGNGKAGLRLEKGVRGLQFTVINRLDPTGVEIIGPDTDDNFMGLSRVERCTSNGIVVVNAFRNRIHGAVTDLPGVGILVSGGGENEIPLQDVQRCLVAGIRLTDKTRRNLVTSYTPPPVNGRVSGSDLGILIDQGSTETEIQRLQILDCGLAGIALRDPGTSRNRILRTQITRSRSYGILIDGGASANLLGDHVALQPSEAFSLRIQASKEAAIRITGEGTDANLITRSIFETQQDQPIHILVDSKASRTLIDTNSFFPTQNAVVVRDGATDTRITRNLFDSMTRRGVFVLDAQRVTLGGSDPALGNLFQKQPTGVEISGPASSDCVIQNNTFRNHTLDAILLAAETSGHQVRENVLTSNGRGILLDHARSVVVEANRITQSKSAGIQLQLGSQDNLMAGNRLSQNAEGVLMSGSETLLNTLRANSISASNGKGIALKDGANQSIQAPIPTAFVNNILYGTTPAPDGSVVELFVDPDGEGETPVGTAIVGAGTFHFPWDLMPFLPDGTALLTANVTDPFGNTSEFSAPFRVRATPVSDLKLAFASTRTGDAEIHVADPPENPAGVFVLAPNAAEDRRPVFNRVGSRIAFVSERTGNRDIYVIDAIQGAQPVAITTSPARDEDPAWSADGTELFFISNRSNTPAIYRTALDGSGTTLVFDGLPLLASPTCSPDGLRIAFAGRGAGDWKIYVSDTHGSAVVAISPPGPGNDTQPAWSPKGDRLLFVSDRDGNPEIYAMNPDGTQVNRVTSDASTDVDPAWGPTGEQIVWASNRSGNYEIYTTLASGTGARRITIAPGDNREPSVAPSP